MVFSSLIFLFFFLPIFGCIYWVSPKYLKNLILFIFSLVFYSWGEPIYFMLMIFSTIVDYTIGLLMNKHYSNIKMRKMFLLMSVVINLSMLGFFKYSDFFISSINSLFSLDIKLLNLALPIGISFYTFQTMSYSIDLYRGKIDVQRDIINFGAYVSMFPQLIAGPIVQYKDVEQQLNDRSVTSDDLDIGVERFLEGLFKKVLLANGIGSLWTTISVSEYSTMPMLTAWIGIIAFAMQLYFDFSGYSDMAIGLGRMMGFKFPENFNYPYLSKSASEFWRRWHMTLGGWFREYVYIPMGGNRVNKLRFTLNIFTVWFLTGLWHGASYNFILWGLYFGLILYLEKIVLGNLLKKIPAFIARIYTIIIILISWVIFAVEDIGSIAVYLKSMFGLGQGGICNANSLYLLSNYIIIMIICILFNFPFIKNFSDKYIKGYVRTLLYIILFIISVSYLVDSTFNPFLYFRF